MNYELLKVLMGSHGFSLCWLYHFCFGWCIVTMLLKVIFLWVILLPTKIPLSTSCLLGVQTTEVLITELCT